MRIEHDQKAEEDETAQLEMDRWNTEEDEGTARP